MKNIIGIKFPKKVRIFLTPKDLKADYTDGQKCPLALAFRRHFKIPKKYLLGVVFCSVNVMEKIDNHYESILFYHNSFNEWNAVIYKEVRNAYLSGDKTQYYVDLNLE